MHDGWTATAIGEWLGLRTEQVTVALDYIAAHRVEVEVEHQRMLAATAANREYWEARNRERLAMIAATPPSPARTALYAKLAEQRARRLREEAGTCREAQTRLTDS